MVGDEQKSREKMSDMDARRSALMGEQTLHGSFAPERVFLSLAAETEEQRYVLAKRRSPAVFARCPRGNTAAGRPCPTGPLAGCPAWTGRSDETR